MGITKFLNLKTLCAGLMTGLTVSSLAISTETVQAASYPSEVLLGAFWESDEDNTDTLYWSTDGLNFYELCEAYTDATPNSADSGLIANTPYPVSTLHDPSIIYKDGYFWMLSGFSTTDSALGRRYVPMIGYSNDLVNWSYPNSGSSTNVAIQGTPPGQELYGSEWDAVAPDFMVDDDQTVWITVCIGYYAQFHANDGNSANDTLQPYLIKASGLSAPTSGDKGTPPVVTYSDAVPINLPSYNRDVTINNRIDSSLYKEGDYYYLSVKKDGVTIEIWRTKNLSLASVQDPNSWELVCDDAVTGFEGPCLTKYQGRYYLYTDKLADYPPDNHDGTRGVYVNVASTGTTGQLDSYTGWLESNHQKIKGWAADGSQKDCRHGTVITVTDPEAIKIIWDLRSQTRYSNKNDTPIETVNMGWYQKESYKAPRYGSKYIQYWYEGDVRQGLINRGKEIYDPGTNGWYWLDSDNAGAMASSKDVYLPIDKDSYNADSDAYSMDTSNWKWARYDMYGKMIYGEDHRHIPGTAEDAAWGYWYFDPTTGAMQFGLTEIPNASGGTKKVYYDDNTGIMLYGEHIINDRLYYFDPHDGTAIDGWYSFNNVMYWYENGQRQGYRPYDAAYRGKEIYDPLTGAWYWLDNVQYGTFATSKDVYLPTNTEEYLLDEDAYGSDPSKWKWVRYDDYGHMIYEWHSNSNGTYYFDPTTGTMQKGWVNIGGVDYHFDEQTSILQN